MGNCEEELPEKPVGQLSAAERKIYQLEDMVLLSDKILISTISQYVTKFSGPGSELTCDQASLFFLFAAGRYAWYNYLTICLLLVQNLDFSLIGQETKGQSVLRVIDRLDRNPPITAISVTL